MKKTILVDLRGLNFPHMTGINTYTMHVLWCLWCVAKAYSNVKIIGLGLQSSRLQALCTDFPFFGELFQQHISVAEYFPGSFIQSRSFFNGIFSIQQSLGFQLTNARCFQADILLQTQPKALPRHPKTKRILAFHDIFSVEFPAFSSLRQQVIENKNLYKNLATDSHIILTNSYATSVDIAGLVPQVKNRIRLVYPALPVWDQLGKNQKNAASELKNNQQKLKSNLALSVLSNQPNFEINEPYFLVLSGCERRKNWSTILQAFAIFLAKNSPQNNNPNRDFSKIRLVFAGSIIDFGYFCELQKMVKKLGLSNIHFVGQITDSEKNVLLKNALALVYPSLYEGFGFPILEAFVAKNPVITSTVGSMPEIAKNAALLVNPLSAGQIATAFEIILGSQDFIKNKVLLGKQRAGDFNWTEMQAFFKKVLVENL